MGIRSKHKRDLTRRARTVSFLGAMFFKEREWASPSQWLRACFAPLGASEVRCCTRTALARSTVFATRKMKPEGREAKCDRLPHPQWRRTRFGLGMMCALLTYALDCPAYGGEVSPLPVVRPSRPCASLAELDIQKVVGRPGSITVAEVISTEKGPFCKVSASVAPALLTTTYLPIEHWSQRYFQGRGGENPAEGFSEAGTCRPALNGEFAYGLSNVRFTMVIGSTRGESADFHPDPERILDYSYRGNHVANQISRALIGMFYGQAPRYAYFIGCSDGGRQALVEAQRFPDDFDGIGAGSPGIFSTAQESTFHIWKVQSNQRADGTNILMPDKVALLHEAVLRHCKTLSGVHEGFLQDPNTCHFDPSELLCSDSNVSKSECFNKEELGTIQKLYDGAHDSEGHFFYFGLPRGSENLWHLPATPEAEEPSISTHATQLAYILLPEPTPKAANYKNITVSQADFDKASQRSAMFNATSTNLKAFARRGGKLVLWHGLSDVMIPARATMAYHEAVSQYLGPAETDGFVRAFYPPGVGHCGGGEGFTEIDILSALMGWVEAKRAPTEILAGKVAAPTTVVGAEGIIQPGVSKPFAAPRAPLLATRPLYPYPYVAQYTGNGDKTRAANFRKVRSGVKPWPSHEYQAERLLGPDSLRTYRVIERRLEPVLTENKPD